MVSYRLKIMFSTAVATLACVASAHAAVPPPVISFQSVLLDDGGSPLPSGPVGVQFQILDAHQQPIYSERQSVDVVRGATSALIGNGADIHGLPTGGIPEDIFGNGEPRFLQVQVDGQTAELPMTIAPVPYAQWSQTCASVADGAIVSGKIAKAAVGFDQLAPDLANALSTMVSTQNINSTNGATQVGVSATFINSGSTTVQGVLQDIDLSVQKGREWNQYLLGLVQQEASSRSAADIAFSNQLDTHTSKITSVEGRVAVLEQADTGASSLLATPALIKTGSYSAGIACGLNCPTVTVDIGFTPSAIKIFNSSGVDYFAILHNGAVQATEQSTPCTAQVQDMTLVLPPSGTNSNCLNLPNTTYYYTIWGAAQQ